MIWLDRSELVSVVWPSISTSDCDSSLERSIRLTLSLPGLDHKCVGKRLFGACKGPEEDLTGPGCLGAGGELVGRH